MRPQISVADYVVAVGRLGANDPAQRQRIAELLGLAKPSAWLLETDVDDPPVSPTETPTRTARDVDVDLELSGPTEPAASSQVPLRVQPLAATENIELSWPQNLPPAPETAATAATRVTASPLLSPMLERGIVQLLLASERPQGDLDLDAVLDACARLDLHDPLPELAEWTVHAGTNLLVDLSTAMAPFEDDVERLLKVAENVGGEATRFFFFEHCPGRGIFPDEPGDVFRFEQRTVVVGTFGYGPAPRSAGPVEWREAIQSLQTRTSVVGVSPFTAACNAFGNLLPMLTWSEMTTTTSAQRVLRTA